MLDACIYHVRHHGLPFMCNAHYKNYNINDCLQSETSYLEGTEMSALVGVPKLCVDHLNTTLHSLTVGHFHFQCPCMST